MDRKKVRVAIVGVGNCANSFVQGLSYYHDRTPQDIEQAPGLIRPDLGGYTVDDIEVVAAFDVVEGKVGADFAEAMWTFPNDTFQFTQWRAKPMGVTVRRGPTLDGRGKYLANWGKESAEAPVDVIQVLQDAQADVLVNYLPVGSEEATKFYANAALRAGCGMVNCIPVFIASDPLWANSFRAKGLPIIGDDIKSQVGATIVHRVLASLFKDRGVRLDRTMQLNVGGNGDFLNMLERDRLESKKISKTNAVVSIAGVDLEGKNVHIGPSDYVQWLGDRKWAFIRLEGRGFGGAPLNIELKLEVWDSPNSAGIVIDAVRCAKLAMDRGLSGPILPPSACFMKSPPEQTPDDLALDILEDWIIGG